MASAAWTEEHERKELQGVAGEQSEHQPVRARAPSRVPLDLACNAMTCRPRLVS